MCRAHQCLLIKYYTSGRLLDYYRIEFRAHQSQACSRCVSVPISGSGRVSQGRRRLWRDHGASPLPLLSPRESCTANGATRAAALATTAAAVTATGRKHKYIYRLIRGIRGSRRTMIITIMCKKFAGAMFFLLFDFFSAAGKKLTKPKQNDCSGIGREMNRTGVGLDNFFLNFQFQWKR